MTHTPDPPFHSTSGPRDAKIAIVGEAWGEQEALVGRPFIGASGQELTRLLSEAGISRKKCFLTNVFALRPQDNKIEALCGKKAEVGKDYSLPPIRMGHYILPKYLGELERLSTELTEVKPNLILALGATATWTLLQSTSIGAIRGTVSPSPWGKVLPTYHPAAILRNWAWRPIVLADLMKAQRESQFPEVIRPERQILVNPTLEEISMWIEFYGAKAAQISVDIETKNRQITCIGFAASRKLALVVPFVDFQYQTHWPTLEDEVQAWNLVQKILALPAKKIFQNGLYDCQYLIRMGLQIRNATEDTMLLHHALFPEMQKGLGFLGSIYTNEASWKLMRKRNEELKKDD